MLCRRLARGKLTEFLMGYTVLQAFLRENRGKVARGALAPAAFAARGRQPSPPRCAPSRAPTPTKPSR